MKYDKLVRAPLLHHPLRLGRNSENIRHIIQNKFAHDFLRSEHGKGYEWKKRWNTEGTPKWFRVLDITPSTYWNIGSGYGNGLW